MIKQIRITTILWLALAATFPSFAQQQQTHTLGSLWPLVKANYPGISARTAAIDAAQLNEQAVKSNMLPQVSAQVQHTYGTYKGNAGAFFPQPGFFNVSGATNPSARSTATAANSFGSATVEWELFSFGKLRKESQAAGALLRKTVSEKEAYLLHLKKTLAERYITLLYNDAKLNWTAKNAARLDSIRNLTAGLSAAGLRPAADSLLASSSYVQAMGERDKWDGLKNASVIHLVELYGTDLIDYTASARRFSNPVASQVNGESVLTPSHPLLDALDRQSGYHQLSGEAQKRSALPSLRLLGGYAYRGTGIGPEGMVSGAWKDGFSNSTSNVLAGIGIVWNITDLHTSRLTGEKLFKEAERTKLLHAQYKQAMQADLSASQAKIVQQYEQLQKTRLAVRQSQDAYNMYVARYKSGLIALTELLQIRTLLEQAENAHIGASRDYWMLLAYKAELTADFDFLFNNL